MSCMCADCRIPVPPPQSGALSPSPTRTTSQPHGGRGVRENRIRERSERERETERGSPRAAQIHDTLHDT
eukprot:16437976-Heterocapsa_arctica.AAC.1